MHPMLNIAVRAARTAGNLIVKNYEVIYTADNSQKSRKNAKKVIIEVICKSYPQHKIISEECEKIPTEEKNVHWIIDPLDGINNFIKCLPHFSVSIAARFKGRTEVAVVYDPIRNELFTAVRGHGAQLNGYRLRCSNTQDLKGTILATGFPFNQKQHAITYIKLIGKIFAQCADFRCTGSTVLDLCYVAANRVDGYFGIGLKPWNFAAGELIAREAGALITDFIGGHNFMNTGNFLVGNPRVIKSLLVIIRDELIPT